MPDLKPGAMTTEYKILKIAMTVSSVVTALGAFLTTLAGTLATLPAEVLQIRQIGVTVTAIGAAALTLKSIAYFIARTVQKGNELAAAFGVVEVTPAAAAKIGDDAPRGHASLFLLLALLGAFLLGSTAARAAPLNLHTHDAFGGGCSVQGNFCAGLTSEIAAMVGIGVKSGKLIGGVVPGVGYGACAMADKWYSICMSLHGSAVFGQDAPTTALITLLATFAEVVQMGPGYRIIGGTPGEVVILFSIAGAQASPTIPQPVRAVTDPRPGLPNT